LPNPVAETVTAVPEALAPRFIELLLEPRVDNDNVPAAVIVPVVDKAALLLDTIMLLPVEAPPPILRAVALLPFHMTLPVVLNVKLLVVPPRVNMLPLPETRFKLVALIKPPVWLIVPEPLAEKLSVVPETLAPRLTVPLLAVVVKAIVPEEARAEVVERVLSLLTDKLEKVEPPEARLRAPAPLFTTVALPVVLRVRLGVEVFILPILPEAEERDTEDEPATVPAV